ncbi:MAG: diaminopimelate epimerase [Maribacter sp.]|nr:diaminopimelate epimerase [Maribacter sp.]
MVLSFYKYQGTGNDFIMVDNRNEKFLKQDTHLISFLCDRKFGIGADGLILLENHAEGDFKMAYFNSDGRESSMCGNGGRCIVAFAQRLGIIHDSAQFMAVDGMHKATVKDAIISLQMKDVHDIMNRQHAIFLDTGSPHHVQMVEKLDSFKVAKEGRKIRYGMYGETGSNINFVEQKDPMTFTVRTYERGVEDETLSCGTGVTAVAIAMHSSGKTKGDHVNIQTLGGPLQVKFKPKKGTYEDVYLIGPAKMVFEGKIEC